MESGDYDEIMDHWARWARRDSRSGRVVSSTSVVIKRLRASLTREELLRSVAIERGRRINDETNWQLIPWSAPAKGTHVVTSQTVRDDDPLAETIDAAVQAMRLHYNLPAPGRPRNQGDSILQVVKIYYGAVDQFTPNLSAKESISRHMRVSNRTIERYLSMAKERIVMTLSDVINDV